jgi:hypothetical protein
MDIVAAHAEMISRGIPTISPKTILCRTTKIVNYKSMQIEKSVEESTESSEASH